MWPRWRISPAHPLHLCICLTVLVRLGLERVAPRFNELRFADWWKKTSRKIEKTRKIWFNSVVILGAWTLWIQSNKCVFDGASPSQRCSIILWGRDEDVEYGWSTKAPSVGRSSLVIGDVPSVFLFFSCNLPLTSCWVKGWLVYTLDFFLG